jgi:hypothetical protein
LYALSLAYRPRGAQVTDDALVALFESGQAPPEGFRHRDHVRVAWWYLRRYPLGEALSRFIAALRQFAATQGKPGLYHETITVAYVLLINERLDIDRDLDWTTFAERHADLLTWRPSALDRYYRPETLDSDRARRTFVWPDRLIDVLQ